MGDQKKNPNEQDQENWKSAAHLSPYTAKHQYQNIFNKMEQHNE